jgi:hypothetical protein
MIRSFLDIVITKVMRCMRTAAWLVSGTGEARLAVRKVLYAVLVGCMVIFLSMGITTAEEKRIKEYGTLMSVESDGTVVIDKSGYAVASYASIFSSSGKKSSLTEFQLPAKIYFEYDYTNKGPVIKRIKEIAQ